VNRSSTCRVRPPYAIALGILIAFVSLLTPERAVASYAYYVGKNLTKDGATLIGGTGEEVSGHWLEIVPRRKHPPGSTIEVGVTSRARMPGELIRIPQVAETFKFITMNYSDYMGFPAPLTNGGLNEYQVAIRDIWAPSRPELVKMTPNPQRGTQYSDQARIALERAKTAREAVRIIGELVEKYGDATYGGNSHLIADPDEGWVVLELAGGKGLWVAERLGPDDVRVSYPGYIGDLPADYGRNPDYMGSANLISFAIEQGWYDPKSGKPFNVHEVYRNQNGPMRRGFKYWAIEDIERELRAMAPVTVEGFMRMVRDPRIADEEAGYGQVAQLRKGLRPELSLLWIAPTGSVTAPFVPWYMGATDVPPEFGLHRYLYKDAGSTFLNPDFQEQEATVFAGRVFKRLLYHTCARPEVFLPEVTAALTGYESRRLAEQPTVEATAEALFKAGKPDLAASYLTFYSNTQAMDALRLGEALVGSIEARAKVQFGLRKPTGQEINLRRGASPNCLVGQDPDEPAP
jgi:hypothetical protein